MKAPTKLQCPHARCKYQWVPRVKTPVSCPKCRQRLDGAKKPTKVLPTRAA